MKANATHSGPAAARNPLFNTNDALDPREDRPVHPGLVEHPLMSPSTQVQILSIIDLTGSASISKIIAELPDHADPVGAIFALIAAGALAVLSTGFIDANTIVARPGDDPLDGTDASVTPPGAGPNDLPQTEPGVDAIIWPDNFADLCTDALPPDLLTVPTSHLQPRIIVGPGTQRLAFGHVTCLNRPGVYILLRGREAYIGYGAAVGFRITDGRQMPGGPSDVIIAIADAHNGLSTDDAKALERMLWSSVAADEDFALVNGVPGGAGIEPERYDQLALFVAQSVLALRQAGLMFLSGSVRQRLAGPSTEPGRLGAPRRVDDLPEGRVMELNSCGLTALAAERSDGTYLLLRGSDVRIDVAAGNSGAKFQRAAWLHAGLLEPAQDGFSYVLMRDLVFASGSAASRFVSGSKNVRASAWQPIDLSEDADVPALAPAL